MNPIFELSHVTRKFGSKTALNDVSMSHETGMVLGLIGENGAGKTTLIKTLLGLLKPDSGTVRVFGLDPVVDPVGVLSRVGYLSEVDTIPNWMRIWELQRYMQGFYSTWDQPYAMELCDRFQLDRNARMMTLSKGQRVRAALMATLAYRPQLLLLDEPSAGLDPVVRREILATIIRSIAEEGRTVVFSSHSLSEVDRIADRLAMIKDGQVAFYSDLDELKASHLICTLILDEWRESPPTINGAISIEGEGREWSVVFQGNCAELDAQATAHKATIDDARSPTIEEIFVAYARPIGSSAR